MPSHFFGIDNGALLVAGFGLGYFGREFYKHWTRNRRYKKWLRLSRRAGFPYVMEIKGKEISTEGISITMDMTPEGREFFAQFYDQDHACFCGNCGAVGDEPCCQDGP